MRSPALIEDEIQRACLELEVRHPLARSLMFTGPLGHEGTTTITCLYGQALATITESNVVIVDANFASPALHQKFSLAMENGLRDGNEVDGTGCLVHSIADAPRLSVVTAGSQNGRSLHTLQQSGRLDAIAARLRRDFRYLLWDTPSPSLNPDIRHVLRHVDGVLVVVESDGTPLEQLSDLYTILGNGSAPMLGVIINRGGRYSFGSKLTAGRPQRRLSS